MSLFRSTLRPPAILSDEAVERYLTALRATVEPDPLFRRRLRGEVVNRYVATREGHVAVRTLPRRMTRIGRAALYASFTLAVSVTSVMAASQESIPGDFLYPLKRQVEELRAQVVPAHLQDELAAYVLAERIQELGSLTDNGSWEAAVALAEEVSADYRAYVAAVPGLDAGAVERYIAALNGMLENLPVATRTAVENELTGMPGIDQSTEGNQGQANGNGNGSGPISSPPGGAAAVRRMAPATAATLLAGMGTSRLPPRIPRRPRHPTRPRRPRPNRPRSRRSRRSRTRRRDRRPHPGDQTANPTTDRSVGPTSAPFVRQRS